MKHVKAFYGKDETGSGFFAPHMVQKKMDYFALKMLRPAEAEAVYQCRPGARVGSIFVEADFRYYEAPLHLERGIHDLAVRQWLKDTGCMIAQGWDTAMSASSTADYSCCVTIGMVPCNKFHRINDAVILKECDAHYDVYILHVYRGKLDIGDLALKVRELAQLWGPERIVIEKKASGSSVMQAVANSGLPVEGVMSEENKLQRAINGGSGAGSTQGWFRSGRVLFPQIADDGAGVPEFNSWLPPFVREIKDFTGERGGIDDQVDAMVHVINYAIREGTAGVQFPTGWRTVADVERQMGEQAFVQQGNPAYMLAALSPEAMQEAGLLYDGGEGTCGHCKHYKRGERPSCSLHKINVPSLSPGCPSFDDGTLLESFPRF